MPTRSEESDLRRDRIQARESHYQSTQRSPKSSTAKKRVDSTDLGSIGAHFDWTPESDSYPEKIDDITNEAYSNCDSPRLRESNFQGQSGSDSNVPKPAPTAYLKQGVYLPLSEMEEFYRQQSVNKRRPPSVSTVDSAVNDENSLNSRREAYVPSIVNPTPSDRSMCTTRDGSRKGDNESVFLSSGQDYKGQLGNRNNKEEK